MALLDSVHANYGLDDAHFFADYGNLYGQWHGRELIGVIGLFHHSPVQAFVGLLVIHPDFRNQGTALRLIRCVKDRFGSKNIGLDANIDHVKHYQRYGFTPHFNIVKFHLNRDFHIYARYLANQIVHDNTTDQALDDFDQQVRTGMTTRYRNALKHRPRTAFVCQHKDHQLSGYGMVRAAKKGEIVAPIFAKNVTTFHEILLELADTDTDYYLEIPACNLDALHYMYRLDAGIIDVYTRMYSQALPDINWHNVYAITSSVTG